MYPLLRPLLFRLDPERAHALTLALLRIAGQSPLPSYVFRRLFEVSDPRLEVEAFGLKFRNPVGLAAGYDKNGVALSGLSALGFGHVEVGTVTRRPQPGNPRPRVHRVPESEAVINQMGFPNDGVEAVRRRLSGRPSNVVIGVNLGKGRDTPLEQAAEDYCALLERVHAHADYIAVNVSSPNTPGLRQLQARSALEALLRAIAATREALTPRRPLLVKLAPDLSEAELEAALVAAIENGVDGLIATNTTVRREGLPPDAQALPGGLSGAPLRERATAVIRFLARHTTLPIVGVGGVMTADDALEKLEAGARLVQVYTGLIYAGPGLVTQINRRLLGLS
jgi:dihydroorotate dehydrogenase